MPKGINGAVDRPVTRVGEDSGTTDKAPAGGKLKDAKIDHGDPTQLPPGLLDRSHESRSPEKERDPQFRGDTPVATGSQPPPIPEASCRVSTTKKSSLGRTLARIYSNSIAPLVVADVRRLGQTRGGSATILRDPSAKAEATDPLASRSAESEALSGRDLSGKDLSALRGASKGTGELFLDPAQQLLAKAETMLSPSDVKAIVDEYARGQRAGAFSEKVAVKLLEVMADRLVGMTPHSPKEASKAAFEFILQTLEALPTVKLQRALTVENLRLPAPWFPTLLENLIAFRVDNRRSFDNTFVVTTIEDRLLELVEQSPASYRPRYLILLAEGALRSNDPDIWEAVLNATLRLPEGTLLRTEPMLKLLGIASHQTKLIENFVNGKLLDTIATLPYSDRDQALLILRGKLIDWKSSATGVNPRVIEMLENKMTEAFADLRSFFRGQRGHQFPFAG
jgi:hypothetical protein